MRINVPEYSRLDNSHQVEGLPEESKQSFYELDHSRTRYCNQEEHLKFEKDVWGDDWQVSSAMYVINRNDRTTTNQDEETFVNALDISINKDFFQFEGEDYSDLIPYAVEHEIYELTISPSTLFVWINGNYPDKEYCWSKQHELHASFFSS